MSHNQGKIEWAKVSRNGVQVAYCKATEGADFADPNFQSNMKGAQQAGIRFGAYHFYRAKDDAVKQADWFLKNAGTNPGGVPHALDIEEKGRDGKSVDKVAKGITAWLEHVSAEIGRPAVIYADPSFWRSLGDPRNFHQHPLWIADWNVQMPDLPGGWTDYAMWQYSRSGRVDGIKTRVDLDWVKPGWFEPSAAV